ncbi:hypothetical protein ACFLXY_11275, partial [Chloroflexota bacterium]
MVGGSDEWRGLLISILFISIIAFFVLPHMSRMNTTSGLHRFFTIGLILKLVFSLFLIWIGIVIYGGLVDWVGYHNTGTQISQYIGQFEFDKLIPYMKWGTTSVDLFTGVIYSITGPSLYGGFLIFACIAFIGSYLFLRAFIIVFPQENVR